MKKYFYIVSLRYAPGNWQHMESFAGQLLKRGYPVRFLISADFRWMNNKYDEITEYTPSSNTVGQTIRSFLALFSPRNSGFRRLFSEYPPAALLLVMWHPWNFLLLRFFKSLFPSTPVILWLHEPFKEDKKIYASKAVIIYLVEWFQTLSLRFIDFVILHSKRAFQLFQRRYPDFKGQVRMIPLQFIDDGWDSLLARQYITFLGRADRAKGIDLFFDLMNDNSDEWSYQIVTSSNINPYVNLLSPSSRQKLFMLNKPKVSDKELRDAAANSLAVLALYKETMQSGVIPLSLMKGTPIIGTNIAGITEWINDGETGVIVPEFPTLADIKAAMSYIKHNFADMTQKCRTSYLSIFDDNNWEHYYGWLSNILAHLD